jgi:hypothetical protein
MPRLLAQTNRLRETLAQRHLVAPQRLAPQQQQNLEPLRKPKAPNNTNRRQIHPAPQQQKSSNHPRKKNGHNQSRRPQIHVAPQLLAPQKYLQIPRKHKGFRSQGT